MFEAVFIITTFFIGAKATEEIVIPAAQTANQELVMPAYDYTKDKVTDGVAYVKEKLN